LAGLLSLSVELSSSLLSAYAATDHTPHVELPRRRDCFYLFLEPRVCLSSIQSPMCALVMPRQPAKSCGTHIAVQPLEA